MSSSPRPLRIARGEMFALFGTGAPVELVKGLRRRIMNSHFRGFRIAKLLNHRAAAPLLRILFKNIYLEGFF